MTISSDDATRIETEFDEWFKLSGFSTEQRVYVARFFADAGFAIPLGERPQRLLHLKGRLAHMRFSTSWPQGKHVQWPGLLHVSALCNGRDLAEAAEFLENRVNVALYAIVVAMNAWCSPVHEYSVVELTKNVSRRQLRRSARRQQIAGARTMRRLDDTVAATFTQCLWKSPHVDALLYAVQHYVQAMDHFRDGAAPMCVEHLFMAVEALKHVVLERHRESTAWSNSDYVSNWKLGNTNQIEAASRLHLVFQGDRITYLQACDASNSMEHGKTTYARLWELAQTHHLKIAQYVRRAIIGATDCPIEISAKLLSRRYDTPVTDLAHEDEYLLIDAPRADLVSGRSLQLRAATRVPTVSRLNRDRGVYEFDYRWESVAPEGEVAL